MAKSEPVEDRDFKIGLSNASGLKCCNKPVGCSMTHRGCKWLKHPWKQAVLFRETPDAPCHEVSGTGCVDDVENNERRISGCLLRFGHVGCHQLGTVARQPLYGRRPHEDLEESRG